MQDYFALLPYPPLMEGCSVMAHLFAYFDESGKKADHPIVAFSGFIDGFYPWRAFQEHWEQLLRDHKLENFHTVAALRHSQAYGTMKPGTADERARNILPFIREITETLELGIVVAVDVNAYKSPRFSPLHQIYGPDPHYLAFFLAMNEMLGYYGISRDYTIGLILDDEEAKAIQCYRLLKKMRLANEEARKRIVSICFSDDRRAAPLQVSDLFAYLTRSEAQRRFAGKEYPYHDLFEAFEHISPETGHHLHFTGGFYDTSAILKFQEWHIEQARQERKG